MKRQVRDIVRTGALCIIAALIPSLLIINALQAGRYEKLEAEVIQIEQKQETLVERNKKLVSDISILSSADRIERRATEDLGMRKAETDDIVRVEMAGSR
ncbi:MAG: cell division protein FtsL [Treponema sp.]|nr:cell division protein FtsL [Treponema sp.]